MGLSRLMGLCDLREPDGGVEELGRFPVLDAKSNITIAHHSQCNSFTQKRKERQSHNLLHVCQKNNTRHRTLNYVNIFMVVS